MSVFYQKFDRHSHGEGLKGQSTHYCAGCGHGLVHKFLADAINFIIIAFVVFFLGFYYHTWWGLAGLFPLLTALIGWCPGYALLGISTLKKK